MKRAFTLAEMMITVAVFTVIMGIVYTALRLNDIYRYNVSIQTDLYRQNKQAQDTIAAELRLCAHHEFTITDDNPDTIRFRVPLAELDDDYNIQWGADNEAGYWIQYRLDGTNLKREILIGAPPSYPLFTEKTIGVDFTDLQFSSSGCPDCIIEIKTKVLKKNIPEQGREISLEVASQVYFRNK